MKKVAPLLLATCLTACGTTQDHGNLASTTTSSQSVESALDLRNLSQDQVQLICSKIFRAWLEHKFIKNQPPKIVKDWNELPEKRWMVLNDDPIRVDSFAVSKNGDGYIKVGMDSSLGTSDTWEGPFPISLKDVE